MGVLGFFRDFPAFIHENELFFSQIHHRHQSHIYAKKPSVDDFLILNSIFVHTQFTLDELNNFNNDNHRETADQDNSPLSQI